MTIRTLRGWAASAVLAVAMTASGCAGASWDDVLYGGDSHGYQNDVRGEVREVGSRSMEVRTNGGRTVRVYHDRYTEVRYGDRDAYEIPLKEATALTPGATRRSPSQISVTLWLDRETAKPLAVRWGEGDELWRTVEVQEFKRLEDNAANRRLLALR